jgi:hypothetical protein
VYALGARVQESQNEVRSARQAHDRRDVERLRRANAVHDLFVVHRLVLAVEGDEVEADGGTELNQIRGGESDAHADDRLVGGKLRFRLVDAHMKFLSLMFF